jgi:hypothetical protein
MLGNFGGALPEIIGNVKHAFLCTTGEFLLTDTGNDCRRY